jgi:chromosome segregation ATPase
MGDVYSPGYHANMEMAKEFEERTKKDLESLLKLLQPNLAWKIENTFKQVDRLNDQLTKANREIRELKEQLKEERNKEYPLASFYKQDPKTCKHLNVQQFTKYCLDCGVNIYTGKR